jgi:DNA-binding NarL/FixJ family response regulator
VILLKESPSPAVSPIYASLEQEQIFYYTEGMNAFEHIWRRLSQAKQTVRLTLRLDSSSADQLDALARQADTSRQDIAQTLLKTALTNHQVAEINLARWHELTPRQQQVAALACLNFTNRQIAARLGISPQTVKSHMRNLLHRFELHSKIELRHTLADWDFSDWA